jgi:hypothetical protein
MSGISDSAIFQPLESDVQICNGLLQIAVYFVNFLRHRATHRLADQIRLATTSQFVQRIFDLPLKSRYLTLDVG